MKYLLVILISAYQKTLSPDHGIMRLFFPFGICRFNPTCSEYAKESIKRHGLIRGIIKGGGQLIKCR